MRRERGWRRKRFGQEIEGGGEGEGEEEGEGEGLMHTVGKCWQCGKE